MSEKRTEIVIRGDLVAFRDITETYARLQDVGAGLLNNCSFQFGRLPTNTIFIVSDDINNRGKTGGVSIVCEYPPQVVTVCMTVANVGSSYRGVELPSGWRGEEDDGGKNTWNLAMPWSVFVFYFIGKNITGFRYLWGKSPMKTLDSNLYRPGLPNTNLSGSVCMGHNFALPAAMDGYHKADDTVEAFWNYNFNNHQSQSFEWYMANWGLTLASWEKKSEKNPMFWQSENLPFRGPQKV